MNSAKAILATVTMLSLGMSVAKAGDLAATAPYSTSSETCLLFSYFVGNGEDGLRLARSTDGYFPGMRRTPAGAEGARPKPFEDGKFSWAASGPLVLPSRRAADPAISVKDPTIVRHQDRWHMFCTVRLASGKVDIEHLSFADWKDANQAPRQLLGLHDQYYCAPQVFYFRPHGRWYLIYQIADKNHAPPFGPAFSTSTDLGDPKSWSKPQWLFPAGTEKRKGLDFWIICDERKAHLFYTSNDGRMWRSETKLAEFPTGWSPPQVALQADIFEASHTYRLKGMNKHLTIVEAQADRRRYYKAYLADRLDGPWQGLADRRDKPFAAPSNLVPAPDWTTNISHGELLRTGVDERLEIDPANLRFLIQGASDPEYRGNSYGKIPWRLGILEMKE